jgi:hypothetical protein
LLVCDLDFYFIDGAAKEMVTIDGKDVIAFRVEVD